MVKIRHFPGLILVVVFLAACSSAGSSTLAEQPLAASSATTAPTLNPPAPAATATPEAFAPSPLPLATSRGPDLEASDPATVSLASGGLQLVEFFRFT